MHGENAAGAVAILGIHRILLQIHLFDRIRRRRIGGFLGRHGRRSVEKDVVLVVRIPARVELRTRPEVERLLLRRRGEHNPRIELNKQVRVTADQRQGVGIEPGLGGGMVGVGRHESGEPGAGVDEHAAHRV